MIKKARWGFRWRGVVGALLLSPLAITALISTPVVQEDSLLDWAVDAVAFTLYLGSFLLAVALGSFIKSWAFAVGILAVSLFYILATVPAEEEDLKERHGEEYVQFRRRVPCFIPRFSLFHTPSEITANIKGLWRECRRAFRWWIWIPLVGELIAHLRSQPWMSHYF